MSTFDWSGILVKRGWGAGQQAHASLCTRQRCIRSTSMVEAQTHDESPDFFRAAPGTVSERYCGRTRKLVHMIWTYVCVNAQAGSPV